MRTFKLVREEDASGVSGTGVVGEGVEFTDLTCVIRWISPFPSTGIYNTVGAMIRVHGHEGKTKAVFQNEEVS